MKQRTAILVATGLTAFVVILVGAIALALTAKTLVPITDAPPETQEQILTGDALIAPGVSIEAQSPTPIPPVAQPVLISTSRATEVALQVIPGGRAERSPELVNFQGKMAFEVALSNGLVYVDALTAQVLSSAVTTISNPPAITPNSAPQSENAPLPENVPVPQISNANDNFDDNDNDNFDDNDNDNFDDNDNDNFDDNGNDNDDNDNRDDDNRNDNDDDDRRDDDDNSGKGSRNSGSGSSNSGKGSGNSGRGGGHDD